MFTVKVARVGPTQKVGAYALDGERGGYFAGYTKCDNCTSDLKIVLPITDARTFARKMGPVEVPKTKIKVKIAKKLQKWSESVTMSEATRSG